MRFAPAIGLSVVTLLGSSALIAAHAQSGRATTATATTLSFPRASESQKQFSLIEDYCIGCHSGDTPTGDLSFDDLTVENMPQHAATWERVIRKLRGNMMPPPDADQPSMAEKKDFIEWTAAYLDFAANQNPDPGRVALHRLNRKEYGNAVRDILKVDLDPATLLPADDAADGFDNLANVLQVSPVFLSQYISAARNIAIQATDQTTRPMQLRAAPGTNGAYHVAGLPIGTTGGFVAKTEIPMDGEYDVAFLAAGNANNRLLLLVDGKIIYDSGKGTPEAQGLKVPPAPPAPAAGAGGGGRGGAPAAGGGGGRGGGGGGGAAAARTTLRLQLTKGTHEFGGAFVARPTVQGVSNTFLGNPDSVPGYSGGSAAPTGADITGPVNYTGPALSPSRQAIFICQPANASAEDACAKQILANLARKAYRRPVNDADLDQPMRFYEDGKGRDGFEAGVQQGIMAILASPKFLYRTIAVPQNARPGQIYPISDMELASRLSFFIWASVPDEELLALAEQRKLSDPAVIEAQVERMMDDPRAESLVTNFAFQWLAMGRLDSIEPDPGVFPGTNGLRDSFKEEMRLFLTSVLLEDKSVLELLDADYTFANNQLARHYGLNFTGNGYQRVSLPADSPRRGILGKGAILMGTSYPNRTAPVLRGAWVLETILGTPPSAPPPGVAQLEDTPENLMLGIRARMEAHRNNPSCFGCHSMMDPLGLALENFDAVGGWRAKDRMANNLVIDASGELPDGNKLTGPGDLRTALLSQPDYFVEAITEKLMMYGLGRALEATDMAEVRDIVHHAEEDGYRFEQMVLRVALSDQFRNSKAPVATDAPAQVAAGPNR